MIMRWLFAALHLLALGVGLGAIWGRARALRGPFDTPGAFRRVFYADTAWGIAALLWIATGLTRLLGGFEKATSFYLHNTFFIVKMALLLAILGLEVWPMTVLIRWRRQLAHGEQVRPTAAPSLARVSLLEALLVVAMVLAATAMARGYGEWAAS